MCARRGEHGPPPPPSLLLSTRHFGGIDLFVEDDFFKICFLRGLRVDVCRTGTHFVRSHHLLPSSPETVYHVLDGVT